MELKKGVFYGVGVGPGDPELLTLKALRLIERCPVIAAPQTESGGMLALDIVRQAVPLDGKTILPLSLPMERDKSLLRPAHQRAADAVAEQLTAGKDVAMLNLGDVSLYATYSYLMELLCGRGYETAMIPGVPSFCAAAARLGISIAAGDEPLHIAPVDSETIKPLLELPGTKVLMKAGRRFSVVTEALRQTELLERSALVENCGLPGERVCPNLAQGLETAGYFATVIVKEA